jgi:hypothetical protein
MAKSLNFRNIEQVALYELELRGQLSDGKWENSRNTEPFWRDLEVKCDPDNVGRDFWAPNDRWNFNSRDLLDVVELRMIGNVRLVKKLGFNCVYELMRWAVDCDGKLSSYKQDEFKAKHPDLYVAAVAALADEKSYTKKDLARDLKDMKAIIKIRQENTSR